MDAVVMHGIEDSAVEERPKPSPSSGEVLLEIHQVQMSVTECLLWTGELPMPDELRDRIDEGGAVAFGHEFCGEVVELGEEVTEFDVGGRVYAPGKISCGECTLCRDGSSFLCENKETIGVEGYPGALAEYLAIPAEPLCKVPAEVSNAEAAALQPLADAVLTVHDADISTGDVVAIVGGGVMGNQCAQVARYIGASEVIGVDIDPKKVRLAEKMGFVGINSTVDHPAEAVAERTDGIGADVVFAAAGGNQEHATDGNGPRAQAFRMVRTGGTIIQVGMLSGDLKLDPWKMRMKAVSVINPISTKGVFQTSPNNDTGEVAAQMVADGRVSIDQFIDVTFDGLAEFEEMIDVTLHKDEHDTLGPAQINVSGWA